MSDFSKITVTSEARVELHDALQLTGAEVSINNLPAGAQVPFVHSHKQNEEIYGIFSGRGSINLDGEDIALQQGDWLRIAPQVKRCISAAPDSAISFVCIQVKAGSLEQFTLNDGVIA